MLTAGQIKKDMADLPDHATFYFDLDGDSAYTFTIATIKVVDDKAVFFKPSIHSEDVFYQFHPGKKPTIKNCLSYYWKCFKKAIREYYEAWKYADS